MEPFHIACTEGDYSEVKKLLSLGHVDPNCYGASGNRALHYACGHDHPAIVSLLISSGADVNLTNKYGETPLDITAQSGFDHIASLLIDAGSVINNQDNCGWGPIHQAVNFGYYKVIILLLDAGADIYLTTNGVNTALSMAIQQERSSLRWNNIASDENEPERCYSKTMTVLKNHLLKHQTLFSLLLPLLF